MTRVEFYDNAKLIGTATQEDFEDTVRNLQGQEVELLRGSHSIVARGYDSTGAFTDTAPYAVSVTGGNARPELNVTSPQTGLVLVEGDTFTIDYDSPSDPDGASDLQGVFAYRFIVPGGGVFNEDPEDIQEQIASDTSSPFTSLAVNTSGWDPGTYTIKVVATDTSGASSYHHYFRIEVKSSPGANFAGDLLSELADPLSLTVSSAKFIGREKSSGLFQNGEAFQLQIDSGVLLTTGGLAIWNQLDSFGKGDLSEDEGLRLFARGDFDLENRVAGLPSNRC